MILKFKTKRDINGNVYTLIIDTEKKTVERNYNPFDKSDYIQIGKKDREMLYNDCIACGYSQI